MARMLINKISGLFLLVQIYLITCVPNRGREDNNPAFLRGSVEFIPLHDDNKANLRDASASYGDENEQQFSRSAVESVPSSIITQFQPLRSAVEYIPSEEDDDDYADYYKPTSVNKFMKIVLPNKPRQSKSKKPKGQKSGAYIFPTSQDDQPQNFRSGSPFQELVDVNVFNDIQLARIQESNLRMMERRKNDYKVICHITNWSFYRKLDGKFVPENLDAKLCTHIVYSFASLDPETLTLKEFDPWADIENNLYRRAVGLDANVPVLLGLGGWTDSSGDKYTQLVSNAYNRQKFIGEVISFLSRFGFAGLHVDWNYPVCWQSDCRAGPDDDKPNYTKFIQELSAQFKRRGLILGASISGYKEVIVKAYDMPELSKAVDFLTVMSYDYHGSWESQTGHVSPLYGDDSDKYPQYNSDYAMQLLVKMGASKEKLILGVPFYGQTFTLAQNRKDIVQGYGSQSSGPGDPGDFTNQPGMMSYGEACYKIKNNKWKTGTDPTGKAGPYATKGDQWVGYDDVVAMVTKAKYVIKSGFGGIGAWTVDLDDFLNRCCFEPFPLLRAINREFGRLTTKAPAGSDCMRPIEPVTPVPAVMTTTVDTGAGGIPVTSDKPMQSSTSNSYVTTMRSTTTKRTTTKRPTTTTTQRPVYSNKPTTTQRPVYTNKPTTTQRPVYAGTTESSATLPVPANVMPVVINGAGCETGEYRRHPQNCNAYYRCVNDELIQQYCAGGLHWNDAASACDWPDSAKCSVDNSASPAEPMTTTTRQTTSWQTTKKPVKQTTTVRPTTTTRSTTQRTTTQRATTQRPTTTKRTTTQRTTTQRIQTTTRRPSWQTTARPTYYNPPTTTTTLIETTTTKKPQKRPTKCNNGQYYPSKACDKFFICINKKKVKQSCPSGLQWSQETTQCDWEEIVKCISRKKYLRILTNQAINLGTSMNAAFLRAVVGDPCNGQNYLPYPGHCSQYLICNWNKLYASECPTGLQWNDNAKACDWAERSTCASKDEIDQDYDEEYEDEEEEEEEEEEEDEEVTDEEEDNSENQIPDFSFAPDNNIVSVQPISTTTTTKRPTTTTKRTTTTTRMTTTTTRRPTTSSPIAVEDNVAPLTGPYKLVCYFTNWAWYRKGLGKYTPDNIDTNLCTHIVYGFAVLNYDELTIRTHDSWADIDNKFYSRVVAAKEKGVKVTLAIGGWNDSAGDKYSRLVRSAVARAKFIKHVVEFLEKYGFDGLDLDWEYPVCWQVDCKKGNPDEKEYFTDFVRELSEAFVPRGLLLSSAVSPSKTVIDAGYDVPALSEYFDWIAVMCYDYHGQWDKKTGHVAPLYYHPDDEIDFFNTNYTMNYWIELGAPREKLIMGMPLYGQSFTLADPKNNGLNAKAPGPGIAGEFTRAAGFLAYYEICDRVQNHGWTVVEDPEGRMGPYAYKGNQWVSFDDQETLRRKTQFIKEMGLGGGMIWALDLDDFKDRCGQGKHPLLKIIHAELQNTDVVVHKPPRPSSAIPSTTQEAIPDDTNNEIDNGEDSEEEIESNVEPIEPHEPVDPDVDIDDNDDTDETDEEETEEAMDFKVICYFTNWAWYRPGIGKFVPEDIDTELCTHIVYGFAVLNRDTLTIKPHDSWADIDNKFYSRAVELKKKGVKVTVAIGGWNDSAGDKYSRLVRDPSARAKFITNVIEFIEKYGFDGLDLDWEYPVCWQVDCTKGNPDEKENFAAFVQELSAEFRPRGLLLSSAVSPAKKVIDAGYDIPLLSEHFDWIAVMAYDYHGQWDKKTGHVAPMYEHADDWELTFNANFTIHYWIEQGADPRKIIMGIPTYGQSFSLAERSNTGLNSMTYGGGEAGPETRARGFLSYYEICTNIRKKGWTVVRDRRGRMGPYAYKGDQWVSFDDAPMVRHKSEYVKAMGLGGAMIWALDLDDFKNTCECEEYPLLRTINRVLRGYPGPHNSCQLEAKDVMNKPPSKPVTMKPTYTSMKPSATTAKPTRTTQKIQTTKMTTTKRTTVGADKTTKRPVTTTTTTTQLPEVDDEEYEEYEDDDETEEAKKCTPGVMFLSHDKDCNKYYQCLHGELFEQSCPGGLHWSDNHCDWPAAAKCTLPDVDIDESENEIPSKPSSTTSKPTQGPTKKPSVTQSPSYNKPTTSVYNKPTTSRTTTKRPPYYTSTQKTTVRPTKRPISSDETPVILTGNNEYKMVCYFTNWAWYRPGDGKYTPDHIDPDLCTHIVYGFAVLNQQTLQIRTHDSWADIDNKFYSRVVEFKNKGIKVTIAIGGWNDSLGDKYSRLVRDEAARSKFIKNVIEFIEKWGFDGLDLDWEYPVCWQVDCTKGKADEKKYFTDFVRELSEEFVPRGLLLSAAVSPAKKVIDAGYDIPALSKYFDWIAVMCYDYHGQWDKKTGHVAPLYVHPEDWETTFNANYSIHYWLEKGAPAKKLILGMPMYGQAFSLETTSKNELNAVAPGPGLAGEFTRAAGFLAYYEICDRINRGGWTVVRDPEGRIGPYAYKDRQWVSYDDVEDIRRKTKFIKDMKLGGGMIWALDLDDFRGKCGCGKHPLLKTLNQELGRISTAIISDCT